MADIVLTTINAKYVHAAFGLRYLYANLAELQSRAKILEFHINQRVIDIAERILNEDPKIVGIGVYIWNAVQALQLVKLIKKIRPEVAIVLGGPEVSYECSQQEVVRLADFTICGEGDLAFAELCHNLLNGEAPTERIIRPPLPSLEEITLPYSLYDEDDAAHRLVYVEASRGCPFTCEFCLSSLEIPVRQFPLEKFLEEMQQLLARGVKTFKFVDRTFNLNMRTSKAILQFFLDHYQPGLFVHFEMIPDRLPDALKDVIRRYPEGCLQFEVGIQSFNPEVGKLISRRQDVAKIEENLRFLRSETHVLVHADLIAGLPGEDLASFANSFDRLVALTPQVIQVGILKRLRGTPIVRHDSEWEMTYNPDPPYELLFNKLIDFKTMQRIGRFARYWELFGNREFFRTTLPLLWQISSRPFDEFMTFSDWLYDKARRRHEISLPKLIEFLSRYLTEALKIDEREVMKCLAYDLSAMGRVDLVPRAGREHLPEGRTLADKVLHVSQLN